MNTKSISAFVLLVTATIAVMSMGSMGGLYVEAKEPNFEKYCYDAGLDPGSVTPLCSFKTMGACKKAASLDVQTIVSECYKNPLF